MRKVVGFICMFFLYIAIFAQSNVTIRVYEVWDDQPAPNRRADWGNIRAGGYPYDADWEQESYPIGNGYMAPIFLEEPIPSVFRLPKKHWLMKVFTVLVG